MPKKDFRLPSNETVTLVYGTRHPGKGTTYLNRVRMGPLDDNHPAAVEYRAMAIHYAGQLAAEISHHVPEFDAVVAPPSSRSDADPYRRAVLQSGCALDLTRNFTRKGNIKIGANETTLEQAIGELDYSKHGKESDIKSLLIVDESIASGKTAAAILHHLRKAGLSNCCKVTVAVWAIV